MIDVEDSTRAKPNAPSRLADLFDTAFEERCAQSCEQSKDDSLDILTHLADNPQLSGAIQYGHTGTLFTDIDFSLPRHTVEKLAAEAGFTGEICPKLKEYASISEMESDIMRIETATACCECVMCFLRQHDVLPRDEVQSAFEEIVKTRMDEWTN